MRVFRTVVVVATFLVAFAPLVVLVRRFVVVAVSVGGIVRLFAIGRCIEQIDSILRLDDCDVGPILPHVSHHPVSPWLEPLADVDGDSRTEYVSLNIGARFPAVAVLTERHEVTNGDRVACHVSGEVGNDEERGSSRLLAALRCCVRVYRTETAGESP